MDAWRPGLDAAQWARARARENRGMNARPQYRPPVPARILDLLAHVPMFQGLSREDLLRIAAATTQVHASRGEILFQRGDPCTGFHYVAYGQVKLAVTTPGGCEKVMHLFGPGRTFGEAVMFSGSPYPVTSIASMSGTANVRNGSKADIDHGATPARSGRMGPQTSCPASGQVGSARGFSLRTRARSAKRRKLVVIL
jgi:hypothetical protein